jgi:hypothetical protein
VIHVVTRKSPLNKGDIMIAKNIEETATPEATATVAKPKGKKKAPAAPHRAPVAPKKAKAGKKASPAKKAPKGATEAKGSREGSKTAQILDLLKRPGGVSDRIHARDRWNQLGSVRGRGPQACLG